MKLKFVDPVDLNQACGTPLPICGTNLKCVKDICINGIQFELLVSYKMEWMI